MATTMDQRVVVLATFVLALAVETGLADLLSLYVPGNWAPSLYRMSTFNAALMPNMPRMEARTEILIKEVGALSIRPPRTSLTSNRIADVQFCYWCVLVVMDLSLGSN